MVVLVVASGRVGKWGMGQGPHSDRRGRTVTRSGDGYGALHGYTAPGGVMRASRVFPLSVFAVIPPPEGWAFPGAPEFVRQGSYQFEYNAYTGQ